jgi:hypothetical protein
MSKQPLGRPSKRRYVKRSRERMEKETKDMLMGGQTRTERRSCNKMTHTHTPMKMSMNDDADHHHYQPIKSKFCLLTGHFENKLFRISFLPSNICGMTNISSDISSMRLFCSGVPVSRIRCSAWVQRNILLTNYSHYFIYIHTITETITSLKTWQSKVKEKC